MKKIFTAIAVSSLLISCSITGLTNDYSKLKEADKIKIVTLERFEKLDTTKIYKISGKQLRAEVAKHEKSIVYVFKNGCTSDLCRPMQVYENYAKQNGFQLFLVMEGYGNLYDTVGQRNNFTSPLFSINTDLYDSRYRAVYTRMFENELLKKDINYKSKEYLGNLFFFEGNRLDKIAMDLPKY
jgi:hypothetical protein